MVEGSEVTSEVFGVESVDDELDLDTPWSSDRRFKPRLMARWLSPPQLLDAGLKELVAGLFETFADRRDSLEARENVVLLHPSVEIAPDAVVGNSSAPLITRPLLPPDEQRSSDGGFWIDYVADLGDGFSTTYSVAAEIAMTGRSPKMTTYATSEGGSVDLERGELLIMGGDEVYPLASDEEYRNRTIGPYETACRQVEPAMGVLAVPGNHDWYDGLTAFLSRFCTEQWIGGWQTRQTRSYWAAKVQPGWWVWGIDVALEHVPIDHHQLQYFRSVAAELEPGDRIILATAMPSWLTSDRPTWIRTAEGFAGRLFASDIPDADVGPGDDPYDQLAYFMTTALAAAPRTPEHVEKPPRFVLALSGDKHFYCRHDNETAEPEERFPHIVAGGGGAYLSLPVRLSARLNVPWPRKRAEGDPGLQLKKEAQWPDPGATRTLAVSALWRMITRNWGLCAVLSLLYLLLATAVQSEADFTASWRDNVEHSFTALASSPWLALLGVALVVVVSLTSRLPAWLKLPLALIQTSIHLVAMSGAAAVARLAMGGDVALEPTTWASLALLAAALAWGGWGGWIWWLYRKLPVASTGGFLVLLGLSVAMAVADWGSWVWPVLLLGLSSVLSGVAFSVGLIVAVALFGDQANELSVAIREDGFKNFIRIHIDADSNLHAYVIGLEKVPYQRLRFRSNEPGTAHRGTPEITTVATQAWIPGVRALYEPMVIDQFTIPRDV